MRLQAERNRPQPSRGGDFDYFNTPKGMLLVFLSILALLGLLQSRSGAGLAHLLVAVATAVVIDAGTNYLLRRKRRLPDSAILTALIVSMVLSPAAPWYVSVSATGIALLSKLLFHIRRKPVFNPAAFGLFVALLLSSSGQDWWGALSGLPVWCIALLVVAGFMVTNRVGKFPQLFAFLGVYFGLFLLMGVFQLGEAAEIFRVPFIHSALFLAFFMLTDPPTSPARTREQLLFGAGAALVSVAVNYTIGGLSFLLVGLLAANGLHAAHVKWVSHRQLGSRQQPSTTTRTEPR